MNSSTNDLHSPNSPNAVAHFQPQSTAIARTVTQRETVVVFWDYENCPCPMSTKIGTLVYDIKRRIDRFLGKKLNKEIKLYCPMQRIHQKTREDATDIGISMMDVPSKRKQESVDKRIIADIGLFAAELAETSAVGHIVLVSGDSDYGYILSRVRDRSYIGQILLFGNDYTKDTLKCHADKYFELFSANLSRKDNPFSEHNQRYIKPSSLLHGYHGHSPYYKSHGSSSNLNDIYDRSATPIYNIQSGYTTYQYNGKYYNTNGNSPNPHSNTHHKIDYDGRSKKSTYSNGSNKKNILNGNKRSGSHSRSPNLGYNSNNNHLRKLKLNKDRDNIKSLNTSSNTNKIAKIKPNIIKSNSGINYIYKRKIKDAKNQSPSPNPNSTPNPNGTATVTPTAAILNKINGIAVPAPVPSGPSLISKSISSTSTTSNSSVPSGPIANRHQVVSQETLEQQLLQKNKNKIKEKQRIQKQKEKEKKDFLLLNCNNSLLTGNNLNVTPSAEFDGINNINNNNKLSTNSVSQLLKINECNIDLLNNNNNDLDLDPPPNEITNDFLNKMIAPSQDDMDKLSKNIVPKLNPLFSQEDNEKYKLSKMSNKNKIKLSNNVNKSSTLIDLKQIQCPSAGAPKKLLIKNKDNNQSPVIKKDNNQLHLKLVWKSLIYCNNNNNNNPRRGEIYDAMKLVYPHYMIGKTMSYADECINTCLRYGMIEEIIRGRISTLYVLPFIFNTIKQKEKEYSINNPNSNHMYINIDELQIFLKQRHPDMIQYFSLQYLNRLIKSADRVFAIHKDDIKLVNKLKDNDKRTKNIRFRVRKSAMQFRQNHNNNNNINNNNDIPSYYHRNNHGINKYYHNKYF